MNKRELATVADQMIGASQALANLAKALKTQAGHLRRNELHKSLTAELWTMHKVADIKRGAELAINEFGLAVNLRESI